MGIFSSTPIVVDASIVSTTTTTATTTAVGVAAETSELGNDSLYEVVPIPKKPLSVEAIDTIIKASLSEATKETKIPDPVTTTATTVEIGEKKSCMIADNNPSSAKADCSDPTKPKLLDIKNIEMNQDLIGKWVADYSRPATWVNDAYYFFSAKHGFQVCSDSTAAEKDKIWVAGSHALRSFMDLLLNNGQSWVVKRRNSSMLESTKDQECEEKKLREWKAADVDVFHLGYEKAQCNKFPGFDIVKITSKTACDMLNRFDLPCCRVAYNCSGDFLVSIRCLDALLSGLYHVSDQVKETFDCCLKTQVRIRKYADRGFYPVYVSNVSNASSKGNFSQEYNPHKP